MRSEIPDASPTQRGALNIVDQILAGKKYFQNLGVYADNWNDTQQTAIALKDTGVGVPILTQVGALNLWFPKFTINDKLIFSIQFPHGLKQDSIVTIDPHVHWFSSTTSANVVRWELSYQWLNNGEVIGADTIITADGTPAANKLQITSFTDQNKTGALISSLLMGTISRITNGATEYAGNVFLQFLDFHHKNDSFGSDAELSKSWPAP
jgi:hypothetical protein